MKYLYCFVLGALLFGCSKSPDRGELFRGFIQVGNQGTNFSSVSDFKSQFAGMLVDTKTKKYVYFSIATDPNPQYRVWNCWIGPADGQIEIAMRDGSGEKNPTKKFSTPEDGVDWFLSEIRAEIAVPVE